MDVHVVTPMQMFAQCWLRQFAYRQHPIKGALVMPQLITKLIGSTIKAGITQLA